MMIESGTSQCPRLYNVILAGPQHREIGTPISTGNGSWGRGPNTEADQKSDFNNVQVGDGAQHREFRKEILQAMRVGDKRI
ncbi:hypothetical protein L4932_04265 [Staphylococcus aureus]|uniref:hypothetical protein n=1 Tax=Staphylococcus aureus TaxID=1280 RepID=UPI0010A32B86|nr:hypothetical protein [Staphylococcus aureus]MBS7752820.1 hypothetical protein [Staphylococcus aureus]MBS7760555.1 hypothetical protein [Staphylococcus aureus]MDN4124409.1 hypothetical protein [Staphylococcus aureus]MVW52233.1 hypothetical protein [Staphylococcus aureus]NSL44648.1 hypothetical protein [Staphylococcus aureus]